MPDVVVTRVRSSGSRPRNLQERLMVRFPSLLRRALDSGWASFDRRDLELNFLYFAPDCDFEFPYGMQTLGIPASFHGIEGRKEGINKLFEVWGSKLEPLYLLDLGDRLLNLGVWHIRGRASAVPLDQELAQLVTVRKGLVVRAQNLLSWKE